jgi:drug/metabolite transporter (DMT)-like permease
MQFWPKGTVARLKAASRGCVQSPATAQVRSRIHFRSASIRTSLSPRVVGLAAAATTILIWVSFIVIGRASASQTLLPLDIVWVRYIGAGLALLPWSWWSSRRRRRAGASSGSLLGLSPLPLRITTIAGMLGGIGYAGFTYSAFFFAPAAHASILLTGSLPLWTALLSVTFLGERISVARGFGLMLILTGCVLGGVSSLHNPANASLSWLGDLMFVAGAICWSCYTVLLRRYTLEAVAATTAIIAFTCAAFLPVYGLGVLVRAVPSHLAAAPWQELAFQAMFQGVGSVVISGISFALMIRHYGPVRSTMITALVPCLSAVAAALVLQEPLHTTLVGGLALVTLGILVGVRPSRHANQKEPGARDRIPELSGPALARKAEPSPTRTIHEPER